MTLCQALHSYKSYKSPPKKVNYKSNRTRLKNTKKKKRVIETKNKNVNKITNYTFPKHG